MAEYPTTSLESNLIGAGLNTSSPQNTYVDFATQMAKNSMDQKTMEENLAKAKLMTKQAQIQTEQNEAAQAAGYNPDLIGTMTKEQAKTQVKAMLHIKGMKVPEDTIEEWYNSLPPLVKNSDIEAFINSATRATTGSSFAFTSTTESIGGKVYNVAVRRRDGKRTDLFDPETGSPVFPDIEDEAATPEEKDEAKKVLERAERQEAGTQARLGFFKERFAEMTWQKLQDKINTSNAPAARAIGQAAVNNMRADRALKLLDQSTGLTAGEYDIVSSDLAAIFKGGVPDVLSLEHQRYSTLAADFAKLKQYLLSRPEEIETTQIQERLKKITMEVKEIDNGIIMNYMDSVAAGYEPFIASDPARFGRMVNAQLRSLGQPGVDVSVIQDIKETPLSEAVKKPKEKETAPKSVEDKKAALRAKLNLGKSND
jgi:hypothetical protein